MAVAFVQLSRSLARRPRPLPRVQRHIGFFLCRTLDNAWSFGERRGVPERYRTSKLILSRQTISKGWLRSAELIRLLQLDVGVPHSLVYLELCSRCILGKEGLLTTGQDQRQE